MRTKFSPAIKSDSLSKTIGIVGLSHLGIVWSVAFAKNGFSVIGFDADREAIASLKNGIVPIAEPGIQEMYDNYKTQFFFSDNPESISNCSIVLFAKDVPYGQNGNINLIPINRLLEKIIPHLKRGCEFIFMCQVPVGFTRDLKKRIDHYYRHKSISLTYCLQTLTIGTSLDWFNNPDRIVIGMPDINKKPSKRLLNTFRDFNCSLEIVSYESAELTKASISLSLACSVTFINTISDLCEKLGADINEIVKVMKLDKRFSPLGYWRPGLGFAGGHIERDLATLTALSQKHSIEPKLIKTIVRNSKERYLWLVKVINEHVYSLVIKPKICIWGLAYKKGTDSLHNAHCLRVIKDFSATAELTAYDPLAQLPDKNNNVKEYSDKYEALCGADCVIILTEWDEFGVNNPKLFSSMKNRVIIDCVNIIGQKIRNNKNINYIGMGTPFPQFK